MANREEKLEYKIRRKIEFCIDRFEKLSNKKRGVLLIDEPKNKLASMIVMVLLSRSVESLIIDYYYLSINCE